MENTSLTKIVVNYFLKTNLSEEKISEKIGLSKTKIEEILTNKELIIKTFNEEGASIYEAIQKRRERSISNNSLNDLIVSIDAYLNNDIENPPKLRLDSIYKDEKNQYTFLTHVALKFRLHLDTLASLFQMDAKVISDNLKNYAYWAHSSIYLLFYYDDNDQHKAQAKFLSYYRNLINAIKNKNLEERKNLITLIGDSKALEFQKKKERTPRVHITDAEIETLINYQIKYCLSDDQIRNIFGISRTNYSIRVNEFFENNPDHELKEQYELLKIDYSDYKKTGIRHG